MRLVLRDAADGLLLALTQDPALPALGRWWELPGGGIAHGEDAVTAAVRELREEAGLVLPPTRVSALPWQRSVRYLRHGETVVQHEQVLQARLDQVAPATTRAGLTAQEQDEVLETRWWALAEVLAGGERFWPARLPDLLPRVLAGEHVVESVEDRMPAGT